MGSSMRMFVSGVLVGAAMTAAVVFWTSAEGADIPPQMGVVWSAGSDGATVKVADKNKVAFVAARLRDGVSSDAAASVIGLEAGKLYVPSSHFDRAMVFAGIGVGDIDWSRADPGRTCAPCILPPPPPPGTYAVVALTGEHAASFPEAALMVP